MLKCSWYNNFPSIFDFKEVEELMNTKNNAHDFGVSLKFLGANCGIVTGSATLFTAKLGNITRNILVDKGCFQGVDEIYNDYREIDGSIIDDVLLTHPHLDHCGDIPSFYLEANGKYSFNGKIYASLETCKEAVHILRDAARVNAIKANGKNGIIRREKRRLAIKREKAIRKDYKSKDIAKIDSDYCKLDEQDRILPYGTEEVEEALKHFVPIVFKPTDRHVDVELFPGITARFIPTSHINGSCMILLTASYEDQSYTVAFTGDIGREETLLYKKSRFITNSKVNSVVMESLHGAESTPNRLSVSIENFQKLIARNLKKNKFVVIPSFGLDRTAAIVFLMNLFMSRGMHFKCFLDSPLGLEELKEYDLAYKSGNSAWFKDLGEDPFSLDNIIVPENYMEHQYFASSYGPSVTITSSCMGHGGRVLDYFEHHVQDELATFIFPGFLTVDSPSRILLETPKGSMCELNGRRYIKRCDTYWFQDFSSHGYYDDKCNILDSFPNLEQIFLNHGSDDTIRELFYEFQNRYPNVSISVPSFEDSIVLT